jgi:hypothetical protein
MRSMLHTVVKTAVFTLGVLTATLPAVAQTVGDAERPIPQLQFGSTGSFTGFQFEQSTFGSAIGAPIPFEGIQFPGFGSRYDVSPQDRPVFSSRDVAEPFDARFAPSRFASSTRTNPNVQPRFSWRMDRGDPFGPATGVAASRAGLVRHRQPFGPVSAEQDRGEFRRPPSRSTPVQRIASEADVRGGRRRPFFD